MEAASLRLRLWLLLFLVRAFFSWLNVSSHGLSLLERESTWEGDSLPVSESSLGFLLIRTAVLLNQDATFGPHLTLITFLLQIQHPRGLGLQHVNFGKTQTFSPCCQQTNSFCPTSWVILRQSGEEKVKVAQSCLTLCDPMDYTVHGAFQARMLWVAFPFSRGSSQPRDQTHVSRIAGWFFTSWATREAPRNERQLEIGWSASLTSASPHAVP